VGSHPRRAVSAPDSQNAALAQQSAASGGGTGGAGAGAATIGHGDPWRGGMLTHGEPLRTGPTVLRPSSGSRAPLASGIPLPHSRSHLGSSPLGPEGHHSHQHTGTLGSSGRTGTSGASTMSTADTTIVLEPPVSLLPKMFDLSVSDWVSRSCNHVWMPAVKLLLPSQQPKKYHPVPLPKCSVPGYNTLVPTCAEVGHLCYRMFYRVCYTSCQRHLMLNAMLSYFAGRHC
jgi:hypothetical protein